MKFWDAFIVFITSVVAVSCNKKMYLHTVKANTADFDFIVSYLQNKKVFELNDSVQLRNMNSIHFGNKCLFNEQIPDTLLSSFMNKYDLDRICFHKDKQNYFDSVIIFHKNYNPILGSSITINYDFGSSKLRDKIKSGEKLPNKTSSIINNKYLYLANLKPAFGE